MFPQLNYEPSHYSSHILMSMGAPMLTFSQSHPSFSCLQMCPCTLKTLCHTSGQSRVLGSGPNSPTGFWVHQCMIISRPTIFPPSLKSSHHFVFLAVSQTTWIQISILSAPQTGILFSSLIHLHFTFTSFSNKFSGQRDDTVKRHTLGIRQLILIPPVHLWTVHHTVCLNFPSWKVNTELHSS